MNWDTTLAWIMTSLTLIKVQRPPSWIQKVSVVLIQMESWITMSLCRIGQLAVLRDSLLISIKSSLSKESSVYQKLGAQMPHRVIFNIVTKILRCAIAFIVLNISLNHFVNQQISNGYKKKIFSSVLKLAGGNSPSEGKLFATNPTTKLFGPVCDDNFTDNLNGVSKKGLIIQAKQFFY